MKKFRLAPVLRIREMQERIAAAESAVAAGAVRTAEAHAADLGAQVEAQVVPERATGAVFFNTLAHGHRLADDAAEARSVVAQREEASRAAQTVWTLAAQSTKALEKLEERHRQAVNAALEQADVRVIDDLVTQSWSRRPVL